MGTFSENLHSNHSSRGGGQEFLLWHSGLGSRAVSGSASSIPGLVQGVKDPRGRGIKKKKRKKERKKKRRRTEVIAEFCSGQATVLDVYSEA